MIFGPQSKAKGIFAKYENVTSLRAPIYWAYRLGLFGGGRNN